MVFGRDDRALYYVFWSGGGRDGVKEAILKIKVKESGLSESLLKKWGMKYTLYWVQYGKKNFKCSALMHSMFYIKNPFSY